MTAVPSQTLPRPATDSVVTAGYDESGLTVRASPGSILTQGVLGGARYPARWLNWILGGFGDWLAYLREASPARLSTIAKVFLLDVTRAGMTSDDAYPVRIGSPGAAFGSAAYANQVVVAQTQTAQDWSLELSSDLPRDGLLTQLTLRLLGTGSTPDTAWPGIALYRVLYNMHTELLGSITYASGGLFSDDHTITLDFSGSPIDLAQENGGIPVRYLLQVIGARHGGAWTGEVLYYDARALVTSKPWT